MIILIVAWAVAMTATLAAHALRPQWRGATKPILLALTAGLAGGLATSMTRRPSRDELDTPTDPPPHGRAHDLDARAITSTPSPHERDHAEPHHISPDAAGDSRPGDPDYISDYIERARRDGLL